MNIGEISGILALILTSAMIVKSFLESRNLDKSGKNIDADSLQKLQKTLNDALGANKELSGRISCLEDAIEEERKRHEIEMSALREMYSDVQDWAERLCSQVRSLGGEPVKIRKKSSNP